MDFLPKIKIDVVVDDDMLEQSLEVICNTASTGKVGDGKIFVSSLDEVVRIRTGKLDQVQFRKPTLDCLGPVSKTELRKAENMPAGREKRSLNGLHGLHLFNIFKSRSPRSEAEVGKSLTEGTR